MLVDAISYHIFHRLQPVQPVKAQILQLRIATLCIANLVLSLHPFFVDADIRLIQATAIESQAISRAYGCTVESCGAFNSNQSTIFCNSPSCFSHVTIGLQIKVRPCVDNRWHIVS